MQPATRASKGQRGRWVDPLVWGDVAWPLSVGRTNWLKVGFMSDTAAAPQKILVAEDDRTTRYAITKMLRAPAMR
jgi:hypothetical protein